MSLMCVCVCYIFSKLRFGARLSQSNRDKVEPARRNVRRTEKSDTRKIPTARKLFPLFSSITGSRFWGRAIQTDDDDVDSANTNAIDQRPNITRMRIKKLVQKSYV